MTEQDFLDQMDRADDWRLHALALADWLEERGDQRALGWRWLVRAGRTPMNSQSLQADDGFWCWPQFSRDEENSLGGAWRHLNGNTYTLLSTALRDAAQAAAKWSAGGLRDLQRD